MSIVKLTKSILNVTLARRLGHRGIGSARNGGEEIELFDKTTGKIRFDEVREQNGFQVFGLDQKFQIDTDRLKRQMYKLQRILHPDKFVNKDPEDQEKSSYLSSLINDYYGILKNPYKRGKYLLSLMTSKSDSEIEDDLGQLHLDSNFLARMMELRETAESHDTPLIDIVKLNSELESELDQLAHELNQHFQAKDVHKIRANLGRVKFLANCHEVAVNRLGSSGYSSL